MMNNWSGLREPRRVTKVWGKVMQRWFLCYLYLYLYFYTEQLEGDERAKWGDYGVGQMRVG